MFFTGVFLLKIPRMRVKCQEEAKLQTRCKTRCKTQVHVKVFHLLAPILNVRSPRGKNCDPL